MKIREDIEKLLPEKPKAIKTGPGLFEFLEGSYDFEFSERFWLVIREPRRGRIRCE